MPQEIRVLQCFECKMYQVDIVKKTNKWQCKLCGVKQSVRKEFVRGTAVECRLKAQQMNLERGQKQQQDADEALDFMADDNIDLKPDEMASSATDDVVEKTESKWNSYVDVKTGNSEMFNFGSTQKWTQSNNTKRQPDSSAAKRSSSDTISISKNKNSKWDEFV